MSSGSATDIDPRRMRDVLGNYPTGVTVVTAIGEDGAPAGMAVGSFTSVSLDPPLVAFLPDKSSTSFPKIRTAASFCVNVLAADQEDVCRAFATKGGDKFAGVAWTPTDTGAPRINGVAAWIDCEFESITEAGDHYLVLGKVRDLHSSGEQLPLVFFQGGYGRFSPLSLVAVPEADFVSHLRLVDTARPELERAAQEIGTECLAIASVGDQLVVLASAGEPSAGSEITRVGQRIPFVPPIGAPFIAWSDEPTVAAWLARADTQVDDRSREDYLTLLHRVRDRGWSLSLGNDQHTELQRAMENYSQGEPGSKAEVARLGAELANRFEPDSLDPDSHYDVRLLSVPVFGSDDSVLLAITLWGLPHRVTGSEVQRYADTVRSAAEKISASLRG